MNRIAAALAVAALATATPAAAQDIAGPVAAAVDQFGQSLAESMTGGPGLFVTVQGEAPLPAASATPMTINIKGEGATAVEAVADRNAQLERVRSVANRFDVAMDVGATNYAIAAANAWEPTSDAWANAFTGEPSDFGGDQDGQVDVELIEPIPDNVAAPAETRTITASVQVKLDRPNESRLPEFVDALEASRSYEANVGVIEVSKNLVENTLRIIA